MFSAFLLLAAAPLRAAEADPIRALEKRVVEHTLRNGMKVLILERPIAPVVSFQMMFRAGGVDEVSGKTGLAHLFEHMMFKGSRTVGTRNFEKEKPILDEIDRVAREIIREESRGAGVDGEKIKVLKARMGELEARAGEWSVPAEFDQIYQREGAEGLNAFTGQDMTAFVVSLPSNKWELWPIMESDRMAHPVLREFYKERDVVMEERLMRYENSPRGKIWENFVAAAYNAHPYGSPTIGWMSDLKRLTLADAEEFFQIHYAPNNAAVAIVGNVRSAEAVEKLERYFSKVSSQALPSGVVTEEPPQEGERRIMVHFDSEPSMIMGFHKPNALHPDDAAVHMIEEILSRGRTSRLNRNVVEKKIAAAAFASNANPGERYPNLIILGGAPRKPYGNADLEKAIWEELEKLKKEKVEQKELQKICNQLEADFIRNIASNGGMASELAYHQTILGNWRHAFDAIDRVRKVTPEDVQKAANRYFQKRNATVAYLEREKGQGKK